MTTERFGARFAVKLVSGEPFARELVDSLDVVGQDGAHHTIRVDPSMNAAAIKAQIARLRLKAPVTVHFNVSEGNSAWFDGIAAELWKESAILELPPMEPGPHSGKGMVSFNVNEHYFRAVAKMAFHYYLCAKPDAIHGSELAFTDIRRFIRYGEGEIEQFFTSPTRSPVYFGTPFGHVVGGGVVSSAKWCHLLMACEGSFGVVVHMQMFLGPHFANPPHYVVLSRDLAASKPRACAHVFLWEAGSGEKGWVQPKAVAATGRPESIAGPWLETTDAANALFVQVRS